MNYAPDCQANYEFILNELADYINIHAPTRQLSSAELYALDCFEADMDQLMAELDMNEKVDTSFLKAPPAYENNEIIQPARYNQFHLRTELPDFGKFATETEVAIRPQSLAAEGIADTRPSNLSSSSSSHPTHTHNAPTSDKRPPIANHAPTPARPATLLRRRRRRTRHAGSTSAKQASSGRHCS